jgi:cation diffusion facilitator family transporter
MEHAHRYQAAKRATLVNASLNLFLAIMKIILGSVGHSHALVADGVHSLSDLLTDAVILFAAKFGTDQPDLEHPYGHRRIETIATIIVAVVLLATALSIGYDTIIHLIHKTQAPAPEWIVVIAAIGSILINEFLYQYTLYEGNKSDSDLLRSNAWHNRSDALISLVVLVSVLGAKFGASFLDAVGALIVAILILKVAIKILWQCISELMDSGADREQIQEITQIIMQTPGVNALHQLRTRAHGTNILLDVHIELDHKISISEAHYISEQVSDRLIHQIDRVTDVVVHADSENDEAFALTKDLPDRPNILKDLNQAWHDHPLFSSIKQIQLHYLKGKIDVDMYLPLAILNHQNNNPDAIESELWEKIKSIAYINQLKLFYD